MSDLILPGRILTGEEAAAELAKLAPALQVFVNNNGKVPAELYIDTEYNPGHMLRYKGDDLEYFHFTGQQMAAAGKRSDIYWVNAHEWESVEG